MSWGGENLLYKSTCRTPEIHIPAWHTVCLEKVFIGKMELKIIAWKLRVLLLLLGYLITASLYLKGHYFVINN